MEGFNSIFASNIDDEITFDTIFGDDTEDQLINIVGESTLFDESGDDIEFPDITDDEDEQSEDDDYDDEPENDDSDDDYDDEPYSSTDDLGVEVDITTDEFESQLFGNSSDSNGSIDPDKHDIEEPSGITTSDLDRIILFDGGDVGDTGEEQIEDEGCKKVDESAIIQEAKKKHIMSASELEDYINSSSTIKSSKLEAPDEDLLDDDDSDDIDTIGETLNLFI